MKKIFVLLVVIVICIFTIFILQSDEYKNVTVGKENDTITQNDKEEVLGVQLVTADSVPLYEDFSVSEVNEVSRFSELSFSHRENQAYNIDLIKNASSTLDFAGHYSVVSWGCGTQCQMGVLIDNITGVVYDIPVSVLGVEYRKDSRLMIVNPDLRDYYDGTIPEWLHREFWVFDGINFKLVHSDKQTTI